MSFNQASSHQDTQYYSGIRDAGSGQVFASSHLFIPADEGLVRCDEHEVVIKDNKQQIVVTPQYTIPTLLQEKLTHLFQGIIQQPQQAQQQQQQQKDHKSLDGGSVEHERYYFSRWTFLNECNTLGELIRTEALKEPDIVSVTTVVGDPLEATLVLECLAKTKHAQTLLMLVLAKIRKQLMTIEQDIALKRFQIVQITEDAIPGRPHLLRGKIRNITTAFCNSIRRTILDDLPNLAIKKVIVHESKNILDDDAIAHRLNLVPIDASHIDALVSHSVCDCDDDVYCSKCSATFDLKIKRPNTDASVTPWMITDLDLVPVDHPEIRPVTQCLTTDQDKLDHRVNICPLLPGQEISMRAVVTLGTGRDDARWKAACITLFVPEVHVEIQTKMLQELKLSEAEMKWFIAQCPSQVFELRKNDEKKKDPVMDIEDLAGSFSISLRDANRCTLCQLCVSASKSLINAKLPASEVNRRLQEKSLTPIATYKAKGQDDSPATFLFAIESVGGMKPLVILQRSVAALHQKLLKVEHEIRRCRVKRTS